MSKLIDLTGQTFYEWTVLKQAKASNTGGTRWECICSCGKPGIVRAHDLRTGGHKSCGHDRRLTIKDIKGRVFGELTTLEYAGDGKWQCECTCGKIYEVRSYDLTTGHTKSCGHATTGFKDIKGQEFGEWTALEYIGKHLWKCQCSCGTISNVHSNALRSGESKSCGHNPVSRRLEDLTGQQFNEWTALRYLGDSSWECKCSCGKISNVAAYDLKQGNSRNCGHNRKLPYTDLTGLKFGQLTVLKYSGKCKYLCECSCGNQKEITGGNLLNGGTIACGCKQVSIYTEEVLTACIENYKSLTGTAPFATDLAKIFEVTPTYVYSLLNKYDLKHLMNTSFGSSYERDLHSIIKGANDSLFIKIKDRTALQNGNEIDLLMQAIKLAIEFNGDYWHSTLFKSEEYHQEKTIGCAKQGLQLIHIFEHEWLDTTKYRKLIKLIENKVDSSKLQRIPARKCEIKQVDKQNEQDFINTYHLQNHIPSKVAYGLYSQNELISIMTLDTSTPADWELLRYCAKDDKAILGGAEKLFKHFIKTHNPNSIISYCDISKFKGTVYTKLGFKATAADITAPNYKWLKYNTDGIDILTRYQTQKQTLIDLGYSTYGNTEDEIMTNMGYLKIYDSGNLRFTWSKP